MIIGITGPAGAGKGVVVEYLAKQKGYTHFSVREFLTQQLKAAGKPINRDNMIALANEMRKEHGPAYIIEQLYSEALPHKYAIIESIRAVGEVTALREKGSFRLLAVTAEQHIRYKRIVKRNSSTDAVTFDTFAAQEAAEMENEDSYKQNIKACMEMADIKLDNNGTFAELYTQVDAALEEHNETA